MISFLSGKILFVEDDHLIIMTESGVGYKVFPTYDIIKNSIIGNKIDLFIIMQVREDAISLYGFANLVVQKAYLHLTSVQGVGSKLAINILSSITLKDLLDSVLSENITVLKSITGVGNKIAIRIVTELKSKNQFISDVGTGSSVDDNKYSSENNSSLINDAMIAITNLGFPTQKAILAINNALKENNSLSLSELIRQSLIYLGK